MGIIGYDTRIGISTCKGPAILCRMKKIHFIPFFPPIFSSSSGASPNCLIQPEPFPQSPAVLALARHSSRASFGNRRFGSWAPRSSVLLFLTSGASSLFFYLLELLCAFLKLSSAGVFCAESSVAFV